MRRANPIRAATRRKIAISASGSNRMAMIIHFTMAGFPVAGEVGAGAGIVYGRSRQLCRPCRPTRLFMAAVAFLHYSVGTGTACRVGPRLTRRDSFGRHAASGASRRVRYLHHHLPGARGVHFPAAAQRAGSAHRARAAALRSLFVGARRHPAGPRRQGGGAAGPRARYRAEDRPSRPSRSTAGRASPSPALRWPPASTPSSARTRPSIAKHFLTGARAAYDMIVTAYAAGDRASAQEPARPRGL